MLLRVSEEEYKRRRSICQNCEYYSSGKCLYINKCITRFALFADSTCVTWDVSAHEGNSDTEPTSTR